MIEVTDIQQGRYGRTFVVTHGETVDLSGADASPGIVLGVDPGCPSGDFSIITDLQAISDMMADES